MPLNLILRVGRKLESFDEILEPFSGQRIGLATSRFNSRLRWRHSVGSTHSMVTPVSARDRYFFPGCTVYIYICRVRDRADGCGHWEGF